jgi:CelD/BcsL family acetyltransferase involved in cellulose biosynthesis
VTSAAASEPACQEAPEALSTAPVTSTLRIERRPFDDIPQASWDRLVTATPCATPFSSWAFHRAWWDAYGANAHEQTLVALEGDELVGIVPLMHRHEVEPGDYATTMRHGSHVRLTEIPADAKAVFFGASYHADYATVLCDPSRLPEVASATAGWLASPDDPQHREPWDVVDLRRLKASDPAGPALRDAFQACPASDSWMIEIEHEDVCPVVTLPEGATLDDYFATLGKHARHEIRRKVRRAEAAGDVRLTDSTDPLADLEAFIDLHQKRWGEDGLFKPTPGGEQSRTFIRRLFELFGADGPLKLAFLTVGDRRIATGISLESGDEILYYNAGVDPEARELSPGVVMVARYVERALERGMRRLDFLRGDESYKYEWGAVNEPIRRLLVRRTEER